MNTLKHLITSIVVVFSLTTIFSPNFIAQIANDVPGLQPNQTIERKMIGGKTHRYRFSLKAGEFFQVRVEQKGVDVALVLTDAAGETLAKMESGNGKKGPETLSFIAEKSGSFILGVGGPEAKANKGVYTISRGASRDATAKDRQRVAVERLFFEGMMAGDSEEQVEAAIEKLEEAFHGWQELKDRYLSELTKNKVEEFKRYQAESIFLEVKISDQQGTLESKQAALPKLEKARKLYREISDRESEADCLHWLGVYYFSLGEMQKALEYFDQALTLRKLLGDKDRKATTLNEIGEVYDSLGEKRKALEFYDRAMPLFNLVGDKRGEATALKNIGSVYNSIGETQKALANYDQALTLFKLIGDKGGEAVTLSNIGLVYDSLGEKQKALGFYDRAMPLFKLVGDKGGEAAALNNIGLVYDSLGEKRKALEFYNQALPLVKLVGNKGGEASTLNNIGEAYDSLGEMQKALEYFQLSLPLRKIVGDKSGEAVTLSNIGSVYDSLGEKQKALGFYDQALPLFKLVGDKGGDATTLNNIGLVYDSLGEKQKALEFYDRALPIFRLVGDKGGEATTLTNFGIVYDSLGEKQKALGYFQSSLPLSRYVRDKSSEANTLSWLGYYWNSLNNPRFAIFYCKRSINNYQQLRSNIVGLDKEMQKTYLRSIDGNYRRLADILITEGRIAEAEEVLAMLKEEEFFAYMRRDDSVAGDLKATTSLTLPEKQAFRNYEIFADEITKIGGEFSKLEKRKNDLPLGESLPAAEQAQFDTLKLKLDDANAVFIKFLEDLKVKFGQKDVRVTTVESDTQGILKRLNQPHTVIISTIVGEDRLNLIVTTADTQRAHSVAVKESEINNLVTEFRDAVKNPNVDPRPLGKKLFDILFPADLRKDLDNIQADTIVWSLDGTLRYVPMSALWDGQKYLVDRYNNAVLTLASRDKISDTITDRTKWQALGVGVSKSANLTNADGTTTNFSPLTAVPQELCSIISDPKKKEFCLAAGINENGIINGLMLPDDEFTLAGFQNFLGRTPVIHIASHFSLNAGDETDSYLLLGGGGDRRFSLAKLRNTRLDRVELLVLSACNTAMSAGDNSRGVEVEGFGAMAQNQGAKTVLATLWSVADDSTRDLMTEFYRILETNPKAGKAEALRQAQLMLLTNDLKTGSGVKRAEIAAARDESQSQPKYEFDKTKPYAHPYYWSPFVLIGNWK